MGATISSENCIENNSNDQCGLTGEVKSILQSLAPKVNVDALQVIRLKGTMTRTVFQIKWPTKKKEVFRKIIVKIYGEGVQAFFDLGDEIVATDSMSIYREGPHLVGRFPNGRMEEYSVHARTLSASDLRNPEISALISSKMLDFHGREIPGEIDNVHLWDRLRNWLNTAKSLSSPEEASAFRLEKIEEEISNLERKLSKGDGECIGFCHNNLQYGHIMIDEETKSISILDYEYASYEPIAFDIANHFCEMAADYHTETPHVLDYSKYPGLEERQRFVCVYLSGEPGDDDVEELLEDVEKYTLASHLLWGLWGIISKHVISDIEFDYLEYARQRFEQYWLRKPTLLNLIDQWQRWTFE